MPRKNLQLSMNNKTMIPLSKNKQIISWFCQALASSIMLQTLYFKFSGAEESVFIFSQMNMEPWGRYLTGILELTASILLMIPAVCWLGATAGMFIMSGAIASHILLIGIEVKEDKGYLFVLALIVFFASCAVIYIRRKQIPFLFNA